MSLYAIIGRDTQGSLTIRRRVRAAHLVRVKELVETGRLVVAGPFPAVDADEPTEAGFVGSLIVAEFPSLEEAQQWAEQDPYVTAGVFASCDVHPFLRVLP